LATPEQPVCGQQNPYFWTFRRVFVASCVRAVRARSIMLKTTGFMKIIRIVQDGFSILHTYRLDI
ncbi:hypothetical protein, partial [Escherichia coli]|uniref:hypothetical protein n=1 Tax=Escherichia coli TaxID=562 RepID=UPI001BD355B2